MLIAATFVGGVIFGAWSMAYWSLSAWADCIEERERQYHAELDELRRQLDEARQLHLWN